MSKNEIIINSKSCNNFRKLYKKQSSRHFQEKNNQNEKKLPLSSNLFLTQDLKKSESTKIMNNNNESLSNLNPSKINHSELDSKNSFITMLPIKQTFQKDKSLPAIQVYLQNNKYNRNQSVFLKQKKNFSLQSFNDEKYFRLFKKEKKFSFPKYKFIINQYRINHDINLFNKNHIFTDYIKEYEKNAYKLKEVVQKDKFINMIKCDLLKLKFNNRLKPFDDL